MVSVYLYEHITVHFMYSVGTFKVWPMLEHLHAFTVHVQIDRIAW